MKQLTLQQRKVLRALAVGDGSHTLSNEFRDLAGVHNASSVKKALLRIVELGHAYYFATPIGSPIRFSASGFGGVDRS